MSKNAPDTFKNEAESSRHLNKPEVMIGTKNEQNQVPRDSNKLESSSESGDLASQIQRAILKMVTQPSTCHCKCANSQLSAKLLQYFFENENKIRSSASSSSDRETVESEKQVSYDGNFGVSSKKEIDLNESTNFDNFEKSSSKSSLKTSKNSEYTKEEPCLDASKKEQLMVPVDQSDDQKVTSQITGSIAFSPQKQQSLQSDACSKTPTNQNKDRP